MTNNSYNDKTVIKKATALQYEQLNTNAPKIIAQGTGQLANNIIKIAKENNIPIKEDPDLMNILSKIELNQEIPEELYKAVVEIFNFIYGLSNKDIDII
jgi:flagellar biosynthesis protein